MTTETTATCTKTHAEHMAAWKSWRDDCEPCGFYVRDVQQCAAGHPDDGVVGCQACGYQKAATETAPLLSIVPDVRPDVVALLTDTDLGSVLDGADRSTWRRTDGTLLTEVEREMVATANRKELVASREQADRIVQVLRDEVEAMNRIMEVTREHFVTRGPGTTFGDVWPLLTDAERAELTPLLAIVGG